MRKLYVGETTMSYEGFFEQPIFSLWKNGSDLAENIFNVYSSYDVDLANISFNKGDNLGEKWIKIDIENLGEYKLSLQGIECITENFENNELRFFELLQHTDHWLRSTVDGLKYRFHSLEYGGHGELDEGIAQDFLQKFHNRKLKAVDLNLANGIIFNWIDYKTGGRFHIEVDHSLDVPDGLFFRYLFLLEKDRVNYLDLGKYYMNVLKDVLAEINLELEEAL